MAINPSLILNKGHYVDSVTNICDHFENIRNEGKITKKVRTKELITCLRHILAAPLFPLPSRAEDTRRFIPR